MTCAAVGGHESITARATESSGWTCRHDLSYKCLRQVVEQRVANPVDQQQSKCVALGAVKRSILVIDDADQDSLHAQHVARELLLKSITELPCIAGRGAVQNLGSIESRS